jgi:predicted anti-sigma-YlaC factor YlaD
MKCEEVQSSLLEDLGLRFDEVIQTHLSHCAECQCFCDDLLELESLAKGLSSQVQAPPTFSSEVMARVSKERSCRLWSRVSVAACLVLVVVSVGFLSWDRETGVDSLSASDHSGPLPEAIAPLGEPEGSAGSEELPYVEVVVENPEEGELILRLPPVIEIRRTDLDENLFIHDTSH